MFYLVFRQACPATVSTPRHPQGILETRGRQQRRRGAAARQQDIIDDGRPVHEQARVGEQFFERQRQGRGRGANGIDHAVAELWRGRQDLADFDAAVIGDDDGVGARAPDVSGNNERHASRGRRRHARFLRTSAVVIMTAVYPGLGVGRGAVIASISSIRRGPGAGTIPIHTDYSMVPEPYPDFALTGVGVWALEDWTEASGPTWIVPGSHLEKRGPKHGEGMNRGIPIEMPKGSVVYFTHGVWHWQGDRTEDGERVTIHSHFNRGILRGLEPKRVDPQMMHRNPPRLGEMLGEDDWFDKLDANGRDYLRAGHMARLQAFTDQQLARLRESACSQ